MVGQPCGIPSLPVCYMPSIKSLIGLLTIQMLTSECGFARSPLQRTLQDSTKSCGLYLREEFCHIRGGRILNLKQVRFGLLETFIVPGESYVYQDHVLCTQYFLDFSDQINKFRHRGGDGLIPGQLPCSTQGLG